MFRHTLFIKDNSVFINRLQWFWKIHYVFDWLIRLIISLFAMSWDFCLQRLHRFCMPFFFSSVTRRYERGCQNKVKNWEESFNKLVNSLFIKINIYLSIYILCTTSHLVILSHWQSYLVYKLVICLCLTLHCLIFWNGYWNGCWLCCKYFSVVV